MLVLDLWFMGMVIVIAMLHYVISESVVMCCSECTICLYEQAHTNSQIESDAEAKKNHKKPS